MLYNLHFFLNEFSKLLVEVWRVRSKISENCKALTTMQWQKSLGIVMETVYQNRGITNKSQNIWLIPDSVNCSVNVLTFEWNRWSSNWRFYCSSFMCERLNQMDKYWKRLTVCSFCCILHLCITTTHICLFLPFWNLPSLLCLREEILRAIFRYLFITADDHMISHWGFTSTE